MYPNRSGLGFVEEAERAFEFLGGLGFSKVHSESSIVRFEACDVYLNVYHSRKSYEVGLEIGPPARSDESDYSMSELIGLFEPDGGRDYRNYAARDEDGVREGLSRLASSFRRCLGTRVVNSDMLAELEKQRQRWKQDLAREIDVAQMRGRLDAAWQAKNYAQVVELLAPVRDALTPTELRKLKYAEKHK